MNTRHQHGFTLWELLMTLLVAGILLGIGVPNVMEFQRNGAMTAVANDLITGVLLARTEAVKRQSPVSLCLSTDPTSATPTCSPNAVLDSTAMGFFVFVDENNNFNADGSRNLSDGTDGNGVRDTGELVVGQWAARGAPIQLSADCGNVSFAPTGFTRQAGALCFPAVARSIVLCDDRGRRAAAGSLSSARVVQIDRPGRAQVLVETAAVNPIIDAVMADCP
jgi:prepilin-type N-terminal cleavage/methylation domain-containing protein